MGMAASPVATTALNNMAFLGACRHRCGIHSFARAFALACYRRNRVASFGRLVSTVFRARHKRRDVSGSIGCDVMFSIAPPRNNSATRICSRTERAC